METLTNDQLNTRLQKQIEEDRKLEQPAKKVFNNIPFRIEEPFSLSEIIRRSDYEFHFKGYEFNIFNIYSLSGTILLENCLADTVEMHDTNTNVSGNLNIIAGNYNTIKINKRNLITISITDAIVKVINLKENFAFVKLESIKKNQSIVINSTHNVINIKNSNLDEIEFKGMIVGPISISESHLSKLIFDGFTNTYGQILTIDNIKFSKSCNKLSLIKQIWCFIRGKNYQGIISIINNSNLGPIEFRNLNLKNVAWEFTEPKMESVKTYQVSWPYKLKLQPKTKENAVNFLSFLDQITSVQNDLNSFDKLNINALRHEAKRKSQKLTWGNSGDKLVLWLSKYTNYYRMEWIRPAIIYFIIGFLLFIWILFLEGKNFNDVSGKLFVFYNPAHDLNFLNKPDLKSEFRNNASYFLDFISRIISGFLIFQFIQGFRKFIIK